ncbi:MAG: OmpA family protein [Ferruginibacter sp.]
MKRNFFLSLLYLIPVLSFGQVQNGAIPKDAQVDVSVSDFKNNMLNNEIIVFRSSANEKEYQGLTNDSGKFSLRLPAGAKYEIFILGFKDSTSYNVLDIPATTGNAYYKKPFKVDIQFQPSKTFVLDDCNFETGKATLQPESNRVLDELVLYLQRKDDEKIEVGGHTDNVGKPAANMILSQDRANTVRAYLLMKGIDPSRVTAKGYGMTVPVADNKTEEGRAQNRRTEVTILN